MTLDLLVKLVVVGLVAAVCWAASILPKNYWQLFSAPASDQRCPRQESQTTMPTAGEPNREEVPVLFRSGGYP